MQYIEWIPNKFILLLGLMSIVMMLFSNVLYINNIIRYFLLLIYVLVIMVAFLIFWKKGKHNIDEKDSQ